MSGLPGDLVALEPAQGTSEYASADDMAKRALEPARKQHYQYEQCQYEELEHTGDTLSTLLNTTGILALSLSLFCMSVMVSAH